MSGKQHSRREFLRTVAGGTFLGALIGEGIHQKFAARDRQNAAALKADPKAIPEEDTKTLERMTPAAWRAYQKIEEARRERKQKAKQAVSDDETAKHVESVVGGAVGVGGAFAVLYALIKHGVISLQPPNSHRIRLQNWEDIERDTHRDEQGRG